MTGGTDDLNHRSAERGAEEYMTTITLEINRSTGIEVRAVRSLGRVAEADGACPGCNVAPFLIVGSGKHRHSRDTYRAGGRCKACGDAVGWIYAKVDTIFGTEEDDAVLNGRARVYA
jgi:hypothetical protein